MNEPKYTSRYGAHTFAENQRSTVKLDILKRSGESCRTCKYFYHTSPGGLGDKLKISETTNNTKCRLKDKEVRSYNICEHHVKLMFPLTSSPLEILP